MSQSATACLLNSQINWPLYSVEATQKIEFTALTSLPQHELMKRAGLVIAKLALAISPHASKIWIACGPGNNGGDGLEAAAHLKIWGKQPIITWLGKAETMPEDAKQALQNALRLNIDFQTHPPEHFDLAIDAILGIGGNHRIAGKMSEWMHVLSQGLSPVLCVDVPTGLNANTGEWIGSKPLNFSIRHTLSLLTLKPGLFTRDGQDAAGTVWFNDLGYPTQSATPTAWLQTGTKDRSIRSHNSHKGNYGDVHVIGGAKGMTGAAVMAAISAQSGGAGRVYLGLLDLDLASAISAQYPTLMVRPIEEHNLKSGTVVCGCGGGYEIRHHASRAITSSRQLVLDADALNIIAEDTTLQIQLRNRAAQQKPTVLTPHPLEAARLLQCSTDQIQKNRMDAAEEIANKFQSITVLKGSGSIIAGPNNKPVINLSGNALLSVAGTGDVLAGLIGAYLANQSSNAFDETCRAVFDHGQTADQWDKDFCSFSALALAKSVGN